MMDEKVVKWRSSPLHRKCIFCKHLRLIAIPANLPYNDYYKCVAKDKYIDYCLPEIDMTRVPRPFCRLFELDTERRI